MKPTSESISFRLPPEMAKRLEAEAEKAGMSRGEYARQLLLQTLDDVRHEQMRHEMRELREEVGKLREDLATAVAALLTRDGPVPLDEAKAWVTSRFLR